PLTHEGGVVVPARIPQDCYFTVLRWRWLREASDDGGIPLGNAGGAATAGGQIEPVAFYLDVHRGVAQREEGMPGPHARESWLLLLACLHAAEEGRHCLVEPKIDLMQELAVDEA